MPNRIRRLKASSTTQTPAAAAAAATCFSRRFLATTTILFTLTTLPLSAYAQVTTTSSGLSIVTTQSVTTSSSLPKTSSTSTANSSSTVSATASASTLVTSSGLSARLAQVPWRAGHAAAFVYPWMILSGGTTDPTSSFSSSTLAGVSSISVWNVNGSWYSLSPQLSPSAPAVLPQIYTAAVALTSTGPMLSLVHNTTSQGASGSIQVLSVNQWDMTFPTPVGFVLQHTEGFSIEVVGTNMYLYGGVSVAADDTMVPSSVVNSLNRLDTNSMTWNEASNGQTLAFHSTCYLPACDCLITFGGTPTGSSLQAQNLIYIYTISTQSWTINTSPSGTPPGQRMLHTATCLPTENKMVVFGGGTNQPFDDNVWVLSVANGTTMTWTQQTTNKQLGPGLRMGHSAVRGSNNEIYIFGGWGPSAALNTNVYMLNTTTWTWSIIPPNSNWPTSTNSQTDYGSTSTTSTGNGFQSQIISSSPIGTHTGLSQTTYIIIGSVSLALILAFGIGFVYVWRKRMYKDNLDGIVLGMSGTRGMSMSSINHKRTGSDDPLAVDSSDTATYLGTVGTRDRSGPASSNGSFRRVHETAEKIAADTAAAALTFGAGPPALTRVESSHKPPRMQEWEIDIGEAVSHAGDEVTKAVNSQTRAQSNESEPPDPPSRATVPKYVKRRSAESQSSQTSPRTSSSAPVQSSGAVTHVFASTSRYPVGYVPDEDDDEADNWTFASSLSFDGSGPPPIRYIPPSNSSRRFSTTTISSSPSALLYASKQVNPWGASVTLTQGSVPIARPVTPPSSSQISLPRMPIQGGTDAMGLSIYDSISPLERLATLGYEENIPAVPPIPPSIILSENRARMSAEQAENSTDGDSSTDSAAGAGKDPYLATNTTSAPSHQAITASSAASGLAHPIFASLISILPTEYKPDPTRQPILGPTNVVLFAHDLRPNARSGRDVTIKAFGRREAWERECRVLMRLKAPFVVELVEVLTIENPSAEQAAGLKDEMGDGGKVRYVTVMERLDETLAGVLRTARKEAKEKEREGKRDFRAGNGSCVFEDDYVRSVVKGIVNCLGWCHKRGIAFCDLKPSNIMHNTTDPPSRWKLIDFEGSRTIGEECVGVITPRYCPPEVARATTYGLEGTNGVVATASVDIWALGCVFYELQTGRPLFPNSITDSTILHFISHPSPATPALNNGMHWNEQSELEIPNFERLVRHEDARQLIKILLSREPAKRGTVTSVLKSAYLNPLHHADNSPTARRSSVPSTVAHSETIPARHHADIIPSGESSRKA